MFPNPVPFRARGAGNFSFTGAYLQSRGLVGDDADDDSARFPQVGDVARQLAKDNPVLGYPARGLLEAWDDNPKITLADLFAEAITHAEDQGERRQATEMLDISLTLSKARAIPGEPVLRRLDRYLASMAEEEARSG